MIRFAALDGPDKTFETKQAHVNFINTVTPVIRLLGAGPTDPAKADAMVAKAGAALAELERLVADLPRKVRAASDMAAKVNKAADADLRKAGVGQKVKMVETLLAAGEPAGAVRAAQVRMYGAMQLDHGFAREDERRGRQIAADLKDDAGLRRVGQTWGAASEADKMGALQKVVAAQSRHFGIAPPEIVVERVPVHDGVVTGGDFSARDGKLHINMDQSSPVNKDFATALNVALHENAHNYQAQLVRQLEAGKLRPGTPDYVQATMFRVNELEPGGYLPGETTGGLPAYRKQPLEDHAWATGPATATKIVEALSAPEAHR